MNYTEGKEIKMNKTVIISGSARKNGDTSKMANQLAALASWDIIDLNDYNFSHYDYEHKNQDDDYLPMIKNIIDKYDTIVFATPVYWYAMSGVMKMFFDRFTDLLKIEKEYGRKLRGKKMAAISCSQGGGNLEDMFWLPFKETAAYLGMYYAGDMHYNTDITTREELLAFTSKIESA